MQRRNSPLENTREEYAAFDALPPELRKFIRECPFEVSARKTLGALWNADYDEEIVLMRLNAWMVKQWQKIS